MITVRGRTEAATEAAVRPARLRPVWLVAALATLAVVALGAVLVGPVAMSPVSVVREVLGLPTDLTAQQAAIVVQIRLPRVLLAVLVGGTLALSGAGYQAVFGNPLADPYLLGAAAGAGLGVTVVLAGAAAAPAAAPAAAFVGALAAVTLAYLLGATGRAGTPTASLILAGVAVASMLTAAQTYILQRNQDTIRDVYSWILGRLSSAGWPDVVRMLPYAAASWLVLLAYRRVLDVMAVGDDEAASLGLHPGRSRLVVVVAASLGTAAAVSVSGLIGFVGIIVPHFVRLLAGRSHRVVLPLSLVFGGAFLCAADVLARTVAAPAETPIGVVTAFFGAPFFVLVLRTSRNLGPGR